MTDIEDRMTTLLAERAERVHVTVDAAAVKQAGADPHERPSRTTWLAGAAALIAVAGGLAVLGVTRSTGGDPVPAVGDEVEAWPYGPLPRTGPAIDDHWHAFYGFEVCGQWTTLQGSLEEVDATGRIANAGFRSTGVHSHDDGVIHIHPFSAAATGPNLTLSTFLDNYGVTLTDDVLTFPAEHGEGAAVAEATSTCGGVAGELVVVVWPDPSSPEQRFVIRDHLAGVPLSVDGMALTVAYTNDPDSVPMPPIVPTTADG